MEKIEIKDVMKELAYKGVGVSMHYDMNNGKFFLDLDTQAKSHLYLYDDFMLCGRYEYETQMDSNDDIESIIRSLCFEFKRALCGRDYYNGKWMELCKVYEI